MSGFLGSEARITPSPPLGDPGVETDRRLRWAMRAGLGLVLVMSAVVVSITNLWLTERFTEDTRSRAELRLSLYANAIVSEVQRNSGEGAPPAVRVRIISGSTSPSGTGTEDGLAAPPQGPYWLSSVSPSRIR